MRYVNNLELICLEFINDCKTFLVVREADGYTVRKTPGAEILK